MRLEFHRLIASDISSIMMYYEDVGGPKLADEFYSANSFRSQPIIPKLTAFASATSGA